MDRPIWLRRCNSFAEEAEADAEFWRSLGPNGRVAVVEQMRGEWDESDEQDQPRLRRVVTRLRTS
jgi:hypothetical protein